MEEEDLQSDDNKSDASLTIDDILDVSVKCNKNVK